MSRYKRPTAKYTLDPGAHVDGWHRYSRETQDDASAVAAIERYCAEHSYTLDRLWGRPATSGSTITSTREFLEFIAAMEERPAQERRERGIVVWKSSRLGRDQVETEYYTAHLRRLGYVILQVGVDLPDSNIRPVLEAFQRWKDEQDLSEISSDVKRGLQLLRDDGYATGGFPPRGFVCVREVNARHPTRRNGEKRLSMRWVRGGPHEQAVALAWQMKTRGAGNREIHEATHAFKDTHCYHDMWKRHVYVTGGYITEDVWQMVQAEMERRRHSHDSPRRLGSAYPLSGLLHCHCGRAMRGMSEERHAQGAPTGVWKRGEGSISYYICPGKREKACSMGRLHAETIEGIVMRTVMDEVLSEANLQRLRGELGAELGQVQQTIDQQVAAAIEQRDRLQREVANLRDAIAQRGALADLVEGIVQRTQERDAALAVLAELSARRAQSNPQIIDDREWGELVAWLRAGATGEPQRVRDALRAVVQRIDTPHRAGLDLTYTLGATSKPDDQLVPRQGCHLSTGFHHVHYTTLRQRRGPHK